MKKILIVEDNEKNMYLISFIIGTMGHQVVQAKTGEEGVALAVAERPDLILMDIQLPGIDGLETTKRIREEGITAVPIIAVTSFAMSGDRERLLAAGCNGYIEKPIDPGTIKDEIGAFL
ncbi:response regulator [Geotalea sp. SG265]|uniref:response regulator n=1 Tax=Geotalea sp. SG265 TaxID=2922867 RepID=UPI001FAF4342|nr:response regulator [Geotalea sp. SG265]